MPKHAHSLLAWSAEREIYELRDGNLTTVLDADAWARWLEDHGSFAFQGRSGRLNLLKEQRKAGPGYWYAYRRQSGRVAKRYAGRGSELTWAHLEALALALDRSNETTVIPQPSAEVADADGRAGPATDLLSPQERRVLRLIAAGRSNTAIAADLIISVNTVKVHVKSIYRKLNVTSRLEAASAARDLGLS